MPFRTDTVALRGAAPRSKENRPLSAPIVRATTFELPSAEAHSELYRSKGDGFYQRFGHPTTSAAAQRIADLEGAERGLMFGSGMGAISTTLLTMLHSGDHVIVHREVFAQTMTLLDHLAANAGVHVTVVDARHPPEVEAAISSRTRVIYVETPSNPLLHILDIAALAGIASRAGCELIVDSTFASPILQQPLALGATVVLHSGTKYIGGHSDVMCGFALGGAERLRPIRDMQVLLGTVADPEAAWLVLRSAATLPMRVNRACASALAIAKFLASTGKAASVRYPWLAADPGYAVARTQMRGGGAVVSFEPNGGVEAARRFLNSLKLIPIATSLGGAETVAELPYDLDFRPEEVSMNRERSPALVRLSVGLEDPDDLLEDIGQAFDAPHHERSMTGRRLGPDPLPY